MTAPIKRGTARRLGITRPEPAIVMTLNPDLTAFGRAWREAFAPLSAASPRMRLDRLAADQQAHRAAFQRISDDIAAMRRQLGGQP